MQHLLPWILASLSLALATCAAGLFAYQRRQRRSRALPSEWALTARPVFNSTERRLYRLLREALPHMVVLSRLPLVRLCQPTDPKAVRYWFGLLGASHVSFAICSNNGRVLAVVDLDGEHAPSRRTAAIKQAVLETCGIRYRVCKADRMPSVAELQQLVPPPGAMAASLSAALDAAASQRARQTLWQDSGLMQDSFFGLDGRGEVAGSNDHMARRPASAVHERPPGPDDVGGVVIDTPVSPLRH